MSETKNESRDHLVELLAEGLRHTVNEAKLLHDLEDVAEPKPASLAKTPEEGEVLTQRLESLSQALGGPPEFYVRLTSDPPTQCDTYAPAAINEILSAFHRCRRSVLRAHLWFTCSGVIREHPDWILPVAGDMESGAIADLMSERFWEHAETSYIRMASYWDRVGQLLDFIFFNIRQFERDGFPAVMDRVHSNYAPLHTELRGSEGWKALREYQTSEALGGLKWLIRRRNLLIHSVHLRPMGAAMTEDPLFVSAYNHLEESVRKKLAPGSASDEIGYIHEHLGAAARLFGGVIELCEKGMELAGRIKRS